MSTHILTDTLAVVMAWYAAYRKFSIQVKSLSKVMLYGECGSALSILFITEAQQTFSAALHQF